MLLCAPAGYGKTTLLADFARHTSIPCCWYFLDRTDTDKITFLENLLASIRHCFPQFSAALDPLLASMIPEGIIHPAGLYRIEAFVDALAVAIATEITERFALLLCNYHEVESRAINDLVNQLLWKTPRQCLLVIESRAIPPLEFASLLAHREMVAWNSNVLRFTTQEIRDLAHLQGVAPLSEMEASQLTMSFDGWIAGILLGTHLGDVQLLQSRSSSRILQGLPVMQVDRQYLFAYLVNEVFTREPDVYTFLKEVAVLQQMEPSLCAELLDITNASEHLEHLEQQGMFVTRSGDGSKIIYTCHPILRELLCDELRQQLPERFVTLHRRAAKLFRARHDYDQAIYHALEANADDTAADLIIETYEQTFARGQIETLTRWIDALPKTATARHPKLLLIRATLYLMVGEHTQALPLLDMASTTLTGQPPVIDTDDLPRLQVEITIIRSKALFQKGAYHEAQALCQQVLAHLSADEVMLRAEAYYRLGVCANLLGDLASGIAQLQKALQLWGRHTVGSQTADVHTALAGTYNLIGNFALAEHHVSRAISCCDQLNNEWGKVRNLTWMGLIKQNQGVFAEAEAVFIQALTIARRIRSERGEAYALDSLGELYQDQGRYDQSLIVIEDGLALARRVRDNYLINCSLCTLAMTYLFMGDASTAMLLISETELPTANGNRIGYERALYELTYGTILLHQHRYDEAYARLTAIETSLNTTGLKREQVLAALRIAACQLAQGQMAGVVRYLEEGATILASYGGYEQLVLVELRRLPSLQRLVGTLPEAARLRSLLHLETEVQEAEGVFISAPPTPVPTLTVAHQPKLKIQALGEPAVFLGKEPITHWRLARTMELFFFLLDCSRPMRKEQIITALLPEVDDRNHHTFYSVIYYLRKALGESCLVSHAGTYTLNLASLYGDDWWYDVAMFEEHYTRAKQLLGSEDAAARAPLLAMVDLYQGDYVQSFYSDWCTFRRDELRRAYLDARGQLAQLAWRQEQFDESVIHWQNMLAIDDCLEEAHYGLMRCYLRQGKKGLVLRQYQRCTGALQHELGVLPGPAIQNLYQRLTGSSSPEQTKVGDPPKSRK
jgi:ATP/maltotriose-dependent transcriptional regulator MalT/DNA-binding SARP family transcriptional activator